MSFNDAARQFEDNFQLIGGQAATATKPLEYNLYSGLANLARGLENLERKISHIEHEIRTLKNR